MPSVRNIKTSLPKDYDAGVTEGVIQDVLQQVDLLHPVGSVVVHAGVSVPPGWIKCDGGQAGRVQNQALFSALGTKYGQGDGQETFNIPNLTAPTGTMYIIRA